MDVTKRNGQREPLDLNKFHDMVEEACADLSGVSPSQIEIGSGIQFYDGIRTTDIQSILVKSAADLISLEAPNYQYVAARLLMAGLRKDVFGRFAPRPLREMIDVNIGRGVYDPAILDYYNDEEIEKLEGYIKHERDLNFTYAGLRQVVDKYLVQDRSSGQIYETPQHMYIMIAATLFHKYPKETRLSYAKRYYDAISSGKINIPTPIMAGVRTPLRQFSSCTLIDVDDTLDSIFTSNTAIGKYIAQRAGIGINMGRVRAINSKIRGGEVQHTGVIPFLKMYEATVRSCTQNGVRGGSATVYFPIWHREIEDIIVLKNNKGTEDNRVRKLDYGIQLSKIFYERFLSGGDITLFSPHDVPGLYEAFATEDFDALYVRYENDKSVPRKTVSAMELFMALLRERAETGRIYIMNMDHANRHSAFLDSVYMSNLCAEILLPTQPIQHIDDAMNAIALCILSAINLGMIKSLDELEGLCDLAVRALDELVDYQHYPVAAARVSTIARRSLGIGYIGVAHYLAKHKVKYSDEGAWKLMHETTEAFQFYLLKASMQLAKEKGACSAFDRTKYSRGILPIDTYKRDVDEITAPVYHKDWEWLRSEIREHGLRNSTLTAQMPSESSSVVSNATNGVEPPRDYISVKKSKKGPLKQVVPGYQHLKNHYTLLWDMPGNEGYIKVVAVMQKFFDQAISGNWSYNPEHYENNEVPLSVMVNDLLTTYKYGWKCSYYANTYDGMTDESVEAKAMLDDLVDAIAADVSSLDKGEECDSCAI